MHPEGQSVDEAPALGDGALIGRSIELLFTESASKIENADMHDAAVTAPGLRSLRGRPGQGNVSAANFSSCALIFTLIKKVSQQEMIRFSLDDEGIAGLIET